MRRPFSLALEPGVLLLSLLLAALAAALSVRVFAIFGVVPGAELLPLALLGGLGSLPRLAWCRGAERRVLVHTAVTAATVAGTVSLLLPLGVAFGFGRADLTTTLLLGTGLVAAVAVGSLGWLYNSPLLPRAAPWPAGKVASWSADPTRGGGWHALALLSGLLVGGSGSGTLVPPLMSAFGLAFLGNGFGLGMLGIGLIVRPTLPYFLRADVQGLHLPHGLMLGAAIASLVQLVLLALASVPRAPRGLPAKLVVGESRRSVRDALRRAMFLVISVGPAARGQLLGLGLSLILYLIIGLAMVGSSVSGTELTSIATVLQTALIVALMAMAYQLLSGLVAARVGWVPSLGGGLAVLVFGYRLGLEPTAGLIVLALSLAAGPLFAEVANQLKAAAELEGETLERQQIVAALVGLAVALAVVGATYTDYFDRGFVPPASVVLATALELLTRVGDFSGLAPWVLVGALVQWLGGRRQTGILLATGLLIDNQAAGWVLLAGLAGRVLLGAVSRGRADAAIAIFGLGCIAGEMLRGALRSG